MTIIRPMEREDIRSVVLIHSEAFKRQFASNKWVACNFAAYPRIMMYVALNDENKIVGYIQWLQKSGFRKEAVLELEQIAVLPIFQGQNIGTELIQESLESVKHFISSQGSILKSIIVTTRSDNAAQRLYEKVLNAKIHACIKELYSADEVVMVAKVT